MLCIRCNDTGQYLGNGMMMTDCTLCSGETSEKKEIPEKTAINRQSKSYQKAIRDIMALNPEISRAEAIKMFDKAYDKA